MYPKLDGAIFGECQALLLNFDALLGQQFGQKHQLRESLSFSLQLFPSGSLSRRLSKRNKSLSDLKKFIEDYRATLGADVMASGQFAFKAFLIQVANHDSADTLPIQFVQYDKLTTEQKAEFEKFTVMVKWKAAECCKCRTAEARCCSQGCTGRAWRPKVHATGWPGRQVHSCTHQRCWKRYGVRPPGGARAPAATQDKYCVYDEPHKDYLYTPAWVEYLIDKMKIDGEYESLYREEVAEGHVMALWLIRAGQVQ